MVSALLGIGGGTGGGQAVLARFRTIQLEA